MAQQDYNPKHEAVNYGSIWTNGLFEDNKPVLNFSRVGVINIRIPWSCIIWGGLFGLIAGIVLFLIYLLNMLIFIKSKNKRKEINCFLFLFIKKN